MDDFDIEVIDKIKVIDIDNDEYERLLREDPWEAVIYCAANGYEDIARELQQELLDKINTLNKHVSTDPEQKKAKLEALKNDPWELVIYLASTGKEDDARRLRDKLLKPSQLINAVFYGGPTEENLYVVGGGGMRHEVEMRIQPPPHPSELIAGREVWVDKETFAIRKLRNTYLTLTDGVLLSGPNANGRFTVGVGGGRFEVDMFMQPAPCLEELTPGREVLVDRETFSIFKLGGIYQQGEVTEVIEAIEPDETTASGLLTLKVRTGQSELLVEALPHLAQLLPPLAAGDKVRVVASLAVALELLERGNRELFLNEVPDVTYDDVGGLDREIAQIREAIEDPYIYANVFQRYALDRPKGILLYGPPGCGKTMIAKAIANGLAHNIERTLTEKRVAIQLLMRVNAGQAIELEQDQEYQAWRQINDLRADPAGISDKVDDQLTRFLVMRGTDLRRLPAELQEINAALEHGAQSYFMSIKGPELLSKWVGEAESSIRGVFLQARERASYHTPVILFFDELESMFSRRGSGISSDVQKTIVPQLLAEIDGVEESRNVIVIGATNRLDLIDPAVLRPGRMDFKIEISRPERPEAQAILAQYLTADLPFSPKCLAVLSDGEENLFGAGASVALPESLKEFLERALDSLESKVRDVNAVLYLNDQYHVHRSKSARSRKLETYTSRAMAVQQTAPLEEWATLAQTMLLTKTPIWHRADPTGDAGHLSLLPLAAPDPNTGVWGVLVLSYRHLQDLDQADASQWLVPWLETLARVIQARRAEAEKLIEQTLNLLFHQESCIQIVALNERAAAQSRGSGDLRKQLKEILSGAMLASIVSRAKRLAVKSEIEQAKAGLQDELEPGVTWSALRASIQRECEESKDQYVFELYGDDARGRAYIDSKQFDVQVLLPADDREQQQMAWLVNNFSKPYPWREPERKFEVIEVGQEEIDVR